MVYKSNGTWRGLLDRETRTPMLTRAWFGAKQVLRLEDELARYHLKLLNSQSPIKACETTEVDKHPSPLVESTVA